MGRSDRGYVAMDPESKRAKNLKKLKKRKEDTGEIRRFPHTLSQVKKLKELKVIKNGFTVREKNKRKSLQAAERSHDKFGADRLKRELVLLEASRKKTIREQTAKVASKGSYPQKIQQAILDLERQKKLLQTRTPSDLDASRKAILYIESQKKSLTNILAGEIRPQVAKEVLKEKRTIKELLDNAPPPKIIIPKPTPPPPPPELLPQIDYQLSDNRSKRIAKMNLRIRNIQREVKYLEGEITRRGRKLSGERIGDIRRDGSIVGVGKKGTAGKIDDLHTLKIKLQKDVVYLINEKKNEDKRRSVDNQKLALQKLGRDGRTALDRSVRRERIRFGENLEAILRSQVHNKIYYSARHRTRSSILVKYNERIRKPLKIIFLVMINQEEYNNITSTDWLEKISGYHNFGIGIAATNNIKFDRGDACDIYTDISPIVSAFRNTAEIPQDTRTEIENLCKQKIGKKITTEFHYVSKTGLPFERPPKIICIMPIHEREIVTIETVNRLKKQKYLDDIILIGDSPLEERIAAKTGVTYIGYFNNPLSWKIQIGIDVARTCKPDAIMISGSDNWLSDNWCEACAPYIKDYDIIGAKQWRAARIEKNTPLELLACRYVHRPDPIGAGRMISSRVLDIIGWAPYTFKRESSMDGMSWIVLQRAKPRVKILPNLINLGVKGSWDMRDSYRSLKQGTIPCRVVANPEKWLDEHFAGWDKSFKRFEPSFRRK